MSEGAIAGDAIDAEESNDNADATAAAAPAVGTRFATIGIPKKRWRAFSILSGSSEAEKETVARCPKASYSQFSTSPKSER